MLISFLHKKTFPMFYWGVPKYPLKASLSSTVEEIFDVGNQELKEMFNSEDNIEEIFTNTNNLEKIFNSEDNSEEIFSLTESNEEIFTCESVFEVA